MRHQAIGSSSQQRRNDGRRARKTVALPAQRDKLNYISRQCHVRLLTKEAEGHRPSVPAELCPRTRSILRGNMHSSKNTGHPASTARGTDVAFITLRSGASGHFCGAYIPTFMGVAGSRQNSHLIELLSNATCSTFQVRMPRDLSTWYYSDLTS